MHAVGGRPALTDVGRQIQKGLIREHKREFPRKLSTEPKATKMNSKKAGLHENERLNANS